MACGVNPGPIKYAASVLGWGNDHTRFPLGPISSSGRSAIEEALQALAPFVYAGERAGGETPNLDIDLVLA
jgi:dihydrodipicolinate synthase/N-acetylneuraminate lyase